MVSNLSPENREFAPAINADLNHLKIHGLQRDGYNYVDTCNRNSTDPFNYIKLFTKGVPSIGTSMLIGTDSGVE